MGTGMTLPLSPPKLCRRCSQCCRLPAARQGTSDVVLLAGRQGRAKSENELLENSIASTNTRIETKGKW